jgi:hypothetical protein
VVVRDERAGDAHAVGPRDLDELTHAVRRVDGDRLSRVSVADEIDEVDHLPGDEVVAGEVPPRQQLTEVQPLAHGPRE